LHLANSFKSTQIKPIRVEMSLVRLFSIMLKVARDLYLLLLPKKLIFHIQCVEVYSSILNWELIIPIFMKRKT